MSLINAGLDMSNPTGLGTGPAKEMDYFGEVFEIHITGDEKIHEVAKELGLKTIQVQLLRPDKSLIRTEHMTSIVKKFDYFEKAYQWTINTVIKLAEQCKIYRVKIESPPYPHYYYIALYAEVHFKNDSFNTPTSKNPTKDYYLGTERVPIGKINELKAKYPNEDLEICLMDNNIYEDVDWFNSYGVK